MLQGGFLADAYCGDLALFYFGLAADAHDVAVADGGGHAVAVACQGKVCPPCSRNTDITFNVLLGKDGGTTGNGTHQRDFHHLRQRFKTRRGRAGRIQPQQVGRGGFQRGGQLFQLGLRDVVDALFQLGDGGLGAVAHALGQLLLRQTQLLTAQAQTGGQFRHIKPLLKP